MYLNNCYLRCFGHGWVEISSSFPKITNNADGNWMNAAIENMSSTFEFAI